MVILDCNYKLLKYRFNFIGLSLSYSIVRKKVGYYAIDKEGNEKYYFKSKQEAREKVYHLIKEMKSY